MLFWVYLAMVLIYGENLNKLPETMKNIHLKTFIISSNIKELF